MKISNKNGVSLMLSYVLLISIVIAISVGVFAWLKLMSNINPTADCKDGTSIIIQNYSCSSGVSGGITLELKNNGYFNITGVILSVGDDPQIFPINYLMPKLTPTSTTLFGGHVFFEKSLRPGETLKAEFSNINSNDLQTVDFQEIKIIQLQPFISDKSNKIVCKNAVIKQEIENCVINE